MSEPAHPRRRLTPIAPWPAVDSLAAHVRAEQVRLVFTQAPPAQLISIVAVGVLCLVLKNVTEHARLWAWFSVVTVLTLGRMALAFAFRRRNPEAEAMREWEIVFVASLGLVSLAWGVGGWLVMPEASPIHAAVVYFFLMGVSGGAVASYSAHVTSVVVAIIALMVPATVSFALHDSAPLRVMALGGVMYLLAAVRSTRTFGFFLRRTFQLQFELHQGYSYAREQARTDDLTGLANRRAFMEQCRSALDQARRYERPLSLVTFDIDHFKKINDTYGHAAGDEALRRVASVARAAARASDTPGRIGGEEFGVLLPETSIVEAEVLAERLRRDLAELRIEHQGHALRLTCSFGVAEQTAATPDADSLMRAADGALYQAKETGRNRVVTRNVRTAVLTAILAVWQVTSAIAQGLPAGAAADLGFSPARLRRIDAVMQSFVDDGRIAGVVTLVARNGRVVHSGAWGMADREAGRRMTTDALFRIASQTKAVTSVAAMMLVEEGRLRLADPVARFVPSFGSATVASRSDTGLVRTRLSRPVTIRDLLTHTAGITYGTWSFEGDTMVPSLYRAQGFGSSAGLGWYFADKNEPICASVDRLGTLPLFSQPGTRFVYGYATDILGCVIERVSGQSLDEFIRTRILEPLRMHDTFFFVPESKAGRLTAVYAARADRLERAPEGGLGQGDYVSGPRRSFSGGAGLVSTAGDYARFLQMLLNGGVLDGARILSPRTVALMTSDHIDRIYGEQGLGFGLGFEIVDDPALAGTYQGRGTFGWGGAYGSNYWVDPSKGLVVVFMIQQMPSGGLDLVSRFRAMVYAAMMAP